MTRTQRLTTVLALNLALVAGLVAVGVGAHSLGVLAEGGDYLLDAAGVGVAMVAIWLSATPAKDTRRRAHPNANTIAALVNAGWLLILELLVASGAIDRLVTRTPHVAGLPVLIVSAVAAVVMLIGALVLRGDRANREPDDDDDLSITAVLLDTVADAAAAAGVAVAGAIILATGSWYWLDPAIALLIAIVISWHATALIRKALKQLPSRSQHEQADLASRAT